MPRVVSGSGALNEATPLYLEMEKAAGEPVRVLLDGMKTNGVFGLPSRRRKIDAERESLALRIWEQLIDFLEAIHGLGWIHGDLAAHNLFWDAEHERLTVIDLSEARRIGHSYGHDIYGHPQFLASGVSPENLVRAEHDTIYAARALSHLLTGGSGTADLATRFPRWAMLIEPFQQIRKG